VSGFISAQSGAPFSILSNWATVTAGGAGNTASSQLTGSALSNVVGFRQTAYGPSIIAASAINPTNGTGTGFSGQVFSNPGPGEIGRLQPRMFSGPWVSNVDLGIQKVIRVTERVSIELRGEAFNIFNHPTWSIPDQSSQLSINDPNFGRIFSTFYQARAIQLALYARF